MIGLYRFVSYAIASFLRLVLWLRPSDAGKWSQRLLLDEYRGRYDLWCHAASVGESRIVTRLVNELLTNHPGMRCLVTTMTTTGQEEARRRLSDRSTVTIRYFSIDAPHLMRRALRTWKPSAIVIAETEIWPNLLLEAHRESVPVYLVNGRLSDRAVRRYRLIVSSLEKLWPAYARAWVKSDDDAQRFRQLAFPEKRLEVAGDMKLDLQIAPISSKERSEQRADLGLRSSDWVLVAGSTRPGEEEAILAAWSTRRTKRPLHLVLAPRHPERCSEVKALVERLGYSYLAVRKGAVPSPSQAEGHSDQPSIRVVEDIGWLRKLYAAADTAFVGGSLVDFGGHNLMEPIQCGVPVLFGPSLATVREAADMILERHWGEQVDSAEELVSVVAALADGARVLEVDFASLPTGPTARIAEELGSLLHAP